MPLNLKLRSLRVLHGLTQKDMSQFLGMKKDSSYSQKECGKRQFSQREIALIIDKFNLSGEQIKEIFFDQFITTKENISISQPCSRTNEP